MNEEQEKINAINEKMKTYLEQGSWNNFNMVIRTAIDHADKMPVTSLLTILRWATYARTHTHLWPFLVGAIIYDLERRGYIKEQIDGLLIGNTGQINL